LSVAAPGVLANDRDVEASPMTVTQVSAPVNGSLTLSANGSFSYTPRAGFSGIDSFTYRAGDGLLSGNIATATITVNPTPNTAPVAVDDFATTRMNTAVAINVLANDTDIDNNISLGGITITTAPTKGGTTSVNNSTGIVTYTPARNFRGTDLFRYRVRDTVGAVSNIATVRINVTR